MSKIKISLTSGAVVEKPLVTFFKGTNGNYIVLDNEANGSMGLPIIIISKLSGANLEKIIDPNEWGAVKDNLKTIIGGTALPYLPVAENLNAPDDFFTQLTLPVASFDYLKNAYAPIDESASTPVAPAAPVQAPASAPALDQTPVEPVAAAPVVETPTEVTLAPAPEVPVAPVESPVPATPIAAVENPTPSASAPVIEAPVINPTVASPVASPASPDVVSPVAPNAPLETTAPSVSAPAPEMPATPVVPTPAAPVQDISAPAIDLPQANGQVSNTVNPDIALIKETFMKSCENMFEALIKKFENKN